MKAMTSRLAIPAALAALSLAAAPRPTFLPPSPPAILDHLEGEWEGEGEIFGAAARFAMTWERELDGRFMGLAYEIRGAVAMSARAHYRIADEGPLRGVWVDSRGEFLSLEATATDESLETIWRSDSEEGRTVYRRSGADALDVTDFVRDGADWRRFATASYGRR